MKTVADFIQRLQNDPEFEQKAQAYENSDAFLEFAKGEGYDFTLDQLLDEFRQEQESTNQPEDQQPAPMKTVADFIQRLQDDPEFERQAQAFDNNQGFLEFLKKEGYDFTLDQLTDGFKQGKKGLKTQADKPLTPLKPASAPTLPKSTDSKIAGTAEPSTNDEARLQKRPVALSPKFEGVSGGRRRGMKWRNIDA